MVMGRAEFQIHLKFEIPSRKPPYLNRGEKMLPSSYSQMFPQFTNVSPVYKSFPSLQKIQSGYI
jgi:hypothetical protein